MYTGYLMPIEQDIINWRMENPVLDTIVTVILALIVIAAMVYVVYDMRKNQLMEEERRREERRHKRAWIKSQGGL